MKEVIAIDGYAATGKSTQAKNIAKHLNFSDLARPAVLSPRAAAPSSSPTQPRLGDLC